MALIPKEKIQGSSTKDLITTWHSKMGALLAALEAFVADPQAMTMQRLNIVGIDAQATFNGMASKGYTAAVLGPYINDYFAIADWSVYEADYEALRVTNLPDILAWIDANSSLLTVAGFSATGQVVWDAVDLSALVTKVNAALSHFE